ncbi:MAG TPA: hypothetical protein VFS44_06440 [Gemmatimonadaceae bacterium]|nr:hypothetical protein [Gemmatimonadaceae bacterium]
MPTNRRRLLTVLLLATAALGGCGGDRVTPPEGQPGPQPQPPPPPPPPPAQPEWRDLGAIPGVSSGEAVVVSGSDVLVGTTDGVWRHPLAGSGAWTRSGLNGVHVQVLRDMPGAQSTVLAGADPTGVAGAFPFYRSDDGGRNWTGSGEGLFWDLGQQYAPMFDLAVQPAESTGLQPVLYANMSGVSIARSLDGGFTWSFVVGTVDAFGTPCHVHVPPWDRSSLYQGCEAPLDRAWVGRFDISTADSSILGSRTFLVGSDLDRGIGNRRPNGFASLASDSGTVYVGLEGGLIAVHGVNDFDWIWKGNESDGRAGAYTYVRAIWIDPADTTHLIFGGGLSAGDSARSGLHETRDRGHTITTPTAPDSLSFATAAITAGTTTGPGGATFVVTALIGDSVRVFVRDNQ